MRKLLFGSVVFSVVAALPAYAEISMDQPEVGQVIEGPTQPSGHVAAGEIQLADYVRVEWTNSGSGFFHSGIEACYEGWNDNEWFETDWFTTNDFQIQGPGNWDISAKHLRGNNVQSSANAYGPAAGAE